MAASVILAFCVVVVCLAFVLTLRKRPKNFPPGPIGFPILGNVTQVGLDCHHIGMKMSEKYGDIIGLRFGSYWAVLLNNPEDIREAFSKYEFSGKYGFNWLMDANTGDTNFGIVMNSGKSWVEQRRFCLHTLRDFGFGKRSMENIIMQEVRELVTYLKNSYCGRPIDTSRLFNPAVFNIIWSIVAGRRYPYDNPELQEVIYLLSQFLKTSISGIRALFFLFPSLVALKTRAPFLFPKLDSDKFREKIFEFLHRTIQEHKASMVEGSPRDFIDTYLEETKKTRDPTSSFFPNPKYGDMPLAATLLDLFIGGSESTSVALSWALFLLAQHPEAQQNVFEDIRNAVGSREVLLADRIHLPRVDATILEILRIAAIGPLGAPHSTTEDVTYKSYFIPKNTMIYPNIYAALHNPVVWGDPEVFRPDRFLDDDGKTVQINMAWIPYGSGKRQCMGQSLARDQFFLLFTNLVQSFRFGMPKDEPKHSLVGRGSIVLAPEPHKIWLSVRK